MRNNLIVLALLLVFLGGVYAFYQRVIIPQPRRIESLRLEIEEKNKQLLAAQILSEKREGVINLIQNNLIEHPGDSLAEKASIPFLRYLTSKMDELGIRLVALTPLDVVGTQDYVTMQEKDFIEVPYEMRIIASYKEFGKFLDILEKSPHLIRVASFAVSNRIDRTSYAGEIAGKPRQHPINLRISTLAILKASYRSESGEFY